MTRATWSRLLYGLAAAGSLLLLALPALPLPFALSPLEAAACVSYAWSVWLLARNHPAGWWVGLVGTAAYGVVFYEVGLYAEVGIQGFYFVTSLQAIWLWLRGGAEGQPRPVGRVPWGPFLASLALVAIATLGLRALLIELRGAAPFWDALTTVVSLAAHLYLMGRYVESWYLWVAVDTIYVPLYASRELYLTSGLYAVFWVLALHGLRTFRRIHREQEAGRAAAGPSP